MMVLLNDALTTLKNPPSPSFLLMSDVNDLLEELVSHAEISNDEKLATLLSIHAALARAIARIGPSSPLQAPEFYFSREDRTENPVTFIRRAYAQWLGKGLTSADIRQLDPKLYQSLRVWICTKGKPVDFDLPTKSRKIGERIVYSGLAEYGNEGAKVLRRISEAQRARIKKRKRPSR